jgi:hypothetical protein
MSHRTSKVPRAAVRYHQGHKSPSQFFSIPSNTSQTNQNKQTICHCAQAEDYLTEGLQQTLFKITEVIALRAYCLRFFH